MFRLDNKTAVIIGGGGGLGDACARALAVQGAKVVVASRKMDSLKETIEKIRTESGSEAEGFTVDVEKEESIINLAEQVMDKYKNVDILVNAHGINKKMAGTDLDVTSWDSLFSINVRGVALACKVFGKIMVEKKSGKIINLSSVRGIRGTDGGNMPYGATKGAVDMITRMLAAEWAPFNVNVNAIGPSLVMTEMIKKNVPPERLQMLLSKTLFKRFITPEDVGAACVYLSSREADNITGQIMYIDGGLTAVG